MKNITLFNQVNLLQSFCKRMATATTSCAHSYKRYYLLLTILLFVGVNNAWAWNPVYLIGDPTSNWSSNKTSYVISNNKDEASAYFYFAKNNYFAVYIGYYKEQAGPDSNGAEMNTGAGGKQFFIWGDGENSNSAKYVGNNGIVEVHAKQKDYGDDRPWIWLTRPTIKIKHGWNGGDWTIQDMTDNNDGTYTYIGKYSGTKGANFGIEGSEATFKYIAATELVGSPQKGHKCLFTYNSSGYKGYGLETQNTGSATITRLYTITYNGNGHTGGTVPDAVDKKHGTAITLSNSIPTRTGYTFAGWNTKQDGTGTSYDKGATYSTNADVTLYAQWKGNNYTVTLDDNGGLGGSGTVSATYGSAMPAITLPTRVGYAFNGYWTGKTTQSTQYYDANGNSLKNWDKNKTTTLYALWTPNTYYVHFDGNGSTSGSMDDAQEFTYDEEQTLSKNIFSKEGCIFTGWNTAADGSGTPYTDQQSVSNLVTEGTITLYAQWSTANCKWLETDIANIESDDEVVIMMAHGKDLYALPYKEELASNSNPMAEPITLDNFAGTIPSTLIWYIVKNESNNFTLSPKTARDKYLTCNSSDNAVRINTGENRNFTIENDFLKNTAFDTYLAISTTATPKDWRHFSSTNGTIANKYQTLKLYKKVCLTENNYWVTWDAREGHFEDGKSTKIEHYQVGAEIIPPTPIRTGYNFTWNPIPENTMPEDNMTYTALWTLKTTTITLSPQGGTGGTESVEATYSQNMPEITPPTRTGYNFQGYFSSNGGTGTKYYNADGTSATAWDREDENFPLIAYWTVKTTTVSFDQNGGTGGQTSTVTATYDEAMPTLITVPTKEGHTFLGYYDATTDGTQYYDAAGNSTQEWNKEDATFTLYAQWQVNQYTVTWDPNGGHWNKDHNKKEVAYNYGAPIVKPTNPEQTGRMFYGWQPEIEEKMPSRDLTYTAEWREVFCEEYSFHWGNGSDEQVKVDNDQACFVQKDNTHEWQVTGFIIPAETKYFVGYKGWWYDGTLGVGDDNGQYSKSVMKEWTWTGDQVMYLAHVGRGYTLGHAVGAVGTLRIYDNTSLDNLDVAFIPNGYGITLTRNNSEAKTAYAFHTTSVEHKWETEVLELPGITNNKYTVGLKTQVDGEYVESHHSETKTLEKIGTTEVVEGKKVVYFKPGPWNTDNAVFAVWDGTNSKWGDDTNKFLTDTDNDGVYQGYLSSTCEKINFVRLSNGTTATNIDWNRKWDQTNDISLATDKVARVYTITGWNETDYTETNASPKTGTNGKFRMWDNSTNKNWFVHFVPYYLLSYDANNGEGTMAPTEYNTEDANNKVAVAACEFTRTGYDFVKWNTAANGSGNGYNAGATYTMTQDAKLYAQWSAQTYDITYNDQGGAEFSGTHGANHPTTHTYDKVTKLVSPTRVGYTFDGWYTTPECDGEPITQLGATEYTTDVTLYAKWTFAMEYNITNTETETIFITSAVGQKIKATQPLILKVSNMPVGTTIDLSAGEHIHFYYANEEIKHLTNKYVDETFELEIAYKPEASNTTEKPSITLNVLGHEKVLTDRISCRSLPNTFAVVAKVGGIWYALPSQGLNSTTPPAAYPIEVDNMADPTAVTAVPANADWSLRQVYEAIRVDATKDRFVENGENFVFVNNEGTPKAINASVSGNYLLTDAQYSGYYETNPGLYEWTPTTSDLETYTLTNAQRTERTLNVSINTVFGVHYDNKATTEVRFLPIAPEANRYTPLALQVVEWKENSVVVMYNGDPAQTASVSVNGGAVQTTELSGVGVQKDIAVYELAADGLATNPTQSLSITIETEKAILPIPYIISGEKTDLALLPGNTVAARQEVAKVSDLVILKDATLTADGAKSNPYKFRNVTIYGGGKLVIPSEAKGFGVASLTLRAGGITDAGDYDYVYPQFDLRGTFTNSAAKINYDYITDYEHWYHLVLPFDGDLGTIKYPTEFYGANVAANNTGSWQIKRYAGEIRATGNYNAWVDIETEGKTSTTAGQGYIFWGAPKKVSVNGGASTRQKWGIQRITMSVTAPNAMTAENDDKAITGLSSHKDVPNNSGAVNDQGWNLVGNPYMVNLTTMSDDGIKAGKLVEEKVDGKWTGKWINNGDNLRYLTIPSEHFDTYEAKTVSEAISANALVPGRAFFVQLDGEANGITFATANRASLMPALLAENSDKPVDIETGIILSNETLQDEVNFWIKDGKTNDYEYNADYPKTPNNNRFNIYGVHTNGDLSWVAINPLLATESMPIGYQVPAAGTYILSLSETYYSEDLEALYVTDHEMSPEVTVDLINAPYEFSVNQAETNNERFTISLKLKSENQGPITGLENTGVQRDGTIKFIYQDKMFILHHGKIYDATGKQVTTINK